MLITFQRYGDSGSSKSFVSVQQWCWDGATARGLQSPPQHIACPLHLVACCCINSVTISMTRNLLLSSALPAAKAVQMYRQQQFETLMNACLSVIILLISAYITPREGVRLASLPSSLLKRALLVFLWHS